MNVIFIKSLKKYLSINYKFLYYKKYKKLNKKIKSI